MIMDTLKKLYIQPSKIEGELKISGAKNSVLRILAASILTKEEIVLENYPSALLDAKVHVEMLECLGKKCFLTDHVLSIKEAEKIMINNLINGVCSWIVSYNG